MKLQLFIFVATLVAWVVSTTIGSFSIGTMGSRLTFLSNGTLTIDILDVYETGLPYILLPLGLLSKVLSHKQRPTTLYRMGVH